MLAYRITNPAPAEQRRLTATELPVPEPGPGEIRVRVEACGVCHTDLHELEGDIPLPKLPVTPGHEIVGVVDRLGPGVSAPALGTRVGIAWLASTCGRCRFCRSGRENLCTTAKFTGLHTDGGYAEFTVARADFVYPLPAGIAPAQAAPLLCAGVIGFRALRLALATFLPRTGQPTVSLALPVRLGLYGFGASAHICFQIARYWGCDIAVFTRSPNHQQLARELGANWVSTATEPPPWPLDASIIFAPAGELVPVALNHLDRGGTLALAGIHMTTIPAIEYSQLYFERELRSVANSTRQDAHDLLALAAAIPIQSTVEEYPLTKAPDALLALKRSHLRAAAVLRP